MSNGPKAPSVWEQPGNEITVVLAALARQRRTYMDVLAAFLEIPSVSADPTMRASCVRAAAFLADRLRRAGLTHVRVDKTAGNPIVYGEYVEAPDAPTILVYGHYDVQPVDPLEEWVSPPFEPRLADGRIWARGASDDKGQIVFHVAAIEAWLGSMGSLPVNLRLVFEGEEESGSTNFEPWLVAHLDELQADAIVISDTEFFRGNRPAITVSMRGNIAVQLDVEGPSSDLHSGEHGGAVINPIVALCAIVTALKDPAGRILIPGFYDQVADLDEEDRFALAGLEVDEEAYRRELGVSALGGEPGFSSLELRTVRPTLDVTGISGGYTGPGTKTIVPARAMAKLSCRLVPNQRPEASLAQLVAAVESATPPGVAVTITDLGGGNPYTVAVDHPLVAAASEVVDAEFHQRPVLVRGGGSIPAAEALDRLLGAPVLLLGFSPPDAQAHAPNESMTLANFDGGARAIARLWGGLAAGWRRGDGTWPS